jgi:hypothetical protein
VVEIEIVPCLALATVLTRGTVSHEDVVATEADLAPGHTIEGNEQDHPRHSHKAANYPDCFGVQGRNGGPVREVERSAMLVHGLRNTAVQE